MYSAQRLTSHYLFLYSSFIICSLNVPKNLSFVKFAKSQETFIRSFYFVSFSQCSFHSLMSSLICLFCSFSRINCPVFLFYIRKKNVYVCVCVCVWKCACIYTNAWLVSSTVYYVHLALFPFSLSHFFFPFVTTSFFVTFVPIFFSRAPLLLDISFCLLSRNTFFLHWYLLIWINIKSISSNSCQFYDSPISIFYLN